LNKIINQQPGEFAFVFCRCCFLVALYIVEGWIFLSELAMIEIFNRFESV
jgi:hypothetical protein